MAVETSPQKLRADVDAKKKPNHKGFGVKPLNHHLL